MSHGLFVPRMLLIWAIASGLTEACAFSPPARPIARASAPTIPSPQADHTPLPTETPTGEVGETWVRIVGNRVTFESPAEWHPTRSEPADSLGEGWQLGIPKAKHASLGFGAAGLERLRPADVLLLHESTISLGGKPGFKWIRLAQVGGSQIVYEYYTTGHNNQGIFGLGVVLAEPDPVIEQQLDRLAQTVVFTAEPTGTPQQ